MVARTLAQLALFALLAACSAETPQRSPGSASSDEGPDPGGDAVPAPSGSDVAPSPGGRDDPEPGARLLTPDGWGPLRIGMSRAEVVAAAGEDAHPDAVGGPDPERCDEFRPREAPEGILVMIEGGILTRISVSRNTDISTPAGFGVGDSGADVQAEYGARAHVDPHQYREPPARYVTVWREATSPVERRGIRYEIDADDSIVHVRAGGPSIEYVEGCV